MRDTLRRAALVVTTWIVTRLTPPPPIDPQFERVRALVRSAESLPVRGERRRHQVLSQLVSEFPSARTRDLAYQIECVLQEM